MENTITCSSCGEVNHTVMEAVLGTQSSEVNLTTKEYRASEFDTGMNGADYLCPNCGSYLTAEQSQQADQWINS